MPKPLITPYVIKIAIRLFICEDAAKPQSNKTAETRIVKPGDFLPVIKPPAIPPRQKNIIEIVKIREV
jgi:hypothetical protein